MSLPVLSLVRLHKAYHAGLAGCSASVEVLRGITLRVMPGELVTVEAARSGGKTTLLFCAAGMLRPDHGEVHWPALPPRPNRPPAGIAYAADRAPPYGFLSTREALLYAATIRELHDPGSARGAEQLIELCGLSEVADLRTSLLSPAHRARLSLATALIPGPKLLLVDDIDGGPDAVSRAAFIKTLERITATGVAVLWAARQHGAVAPAAASYSLERGVLTRTALGAVPTGRRIALELDVPSPDRVVERLYPLKTRRRGAHLRVPLEGATPESILSLLRDLRIPVYGSRVVREEP